MNKFNEAVAKLEGGCGAVGYNMSRGFTIPKDRYDSKDPVKRLSGVHLLDYVLTMKIKGDHFITHKAFHALAYLCAEVVGIPKTDFYIAIDGFIYSHRTSAYLIYRKHNKQQRGYLQSEERHHANCDLLLPLDYIVPTPENCTKLFNIITNVRSAGFATKIVLQLALRKYNGIN